MLTQSEAVSYLLQRKLLSPAHIVAGDLVIADVSRRHHNYTITSSQGPNYVLKQGVGKDRAAAIEREAAVYQLLDSQVEGLSRYLPRFIAYDAEQHVLILELVDGAQNLREYHRHRGYFPVSLAKVLGGVLGTLHRLTRTTKSGAEAGQPAADQAPWVFSIHRPTIQFMKDCSRANLQLIEIIQQFSSFCDLLDELREEWRMDVLIHRDIKWDNCLIFGASPTARKSRLKFIDWELATLGDPCWDVGSVFNDYLSFWMLSMPVTGEMAPAHFLQLARYPLEKMQPALRVFWETYRGEMSLDDATTDRWLLRAIRCGAARLVQTAFEQTQTSMQLTGNIICFLQLSLNLLQRPQEAATQLLGIPLRGLQVQ